MIKHLIALGSLMTLCVPQGMTQTLNDYNEVFRTIESVGVSVIVNSPECDIKPVHGWYNGLRRKLIICQKNKVKGNTNQVEWTAEDLDTLLHEAHHVVQDCMDNELDSVLKPVYDRPLKLAFDVMGPVKIGYVIDAYAEMTPEQKILEIEAFAVAHMNDPQEQVSDIQRFCSKV